MDSDFKGRKKKIIEKPHFPGGKKAMKDFIIKNLTYPPEAIKNKIEGSVHCRYKLNHLGKVVDVDVLSGIGYGCDQEAIRLIKSMTFEPPKIPHKVKAFFQKTIRIHFKLKKSNEKSIAKNSKTTFLYKMESKTPIEKKSKKKVYTYTLKVN
jgi:TonB family protein